MKHQLWPIILVLAVLVAILADASGAFTGMSAIRNQWWPAPTPLAIEVAAPDETLILVAHFHVTTTSSSEPDVKIVRRIREELEELGEEDVRVALEPSELTADDREKAEALGMRYGASMVIWGEDTGVQIIVNYLNIRQPDYDAAKAKIVADSWTERASPANPDPYARFVTEDLPSQLTFFTLFALAQSYFANSAYPRAMEVLERAVDSSPVGTQTKPWADAYFILGWLYDRVENNIDLAILSFDQAIRVDSCSTSALINRGLAYARQDHWEQAIQDVSRAIECDSSNALAYSDRGLLYTVQGRWAEAISDYDQAVKLDSSYATVFINRGLAYGLQERWEEALQDLNRAIELDPGDIMAYVNRGNVLAEQERWEEAAQDYDKAIDLEPDFGAVYNNRGAMYAHRGRWEEAVLDYDRAIGIDPSLGAAYFNRGNALAAQGLWKEALADLNRVVSTANQYPDYHFWRALVHIGIGDLSAASADLRAHLELLGKVPGRADVVLKYTAWIASLDAGVRPITEREVLELIHSHYETLH